MKNEKEMKAWLDETRSRQPLVIAGPCSAETEKQVLTIAHALKDTEVAYMRAGIWKPRTRPGNFEGVGAIGLKWLQRAREETGIKTAIEVANTAHVKLALEHDIDLLWIGARSTVSPFIVQEIAEALKGTDKVVLVKNPVNPDLSLWLGAVERLQASGIKKLGVVHRGFSTYEKTRYRNIPEWQIPIELQNRFPDLPLLCDPSHITGNRDMVFDVAQTALDLNFDGLMIETHHQPDKAWSDPAQQVTPATLTDILQKLKIRKETFDDEINIQKLETLRKRIDEIDSELIRAMGKRMKVAGDIGVLKKQFNVAVLQTRRWNQILDRMMREGTGQGLSKAFIIRLFRAIHQESIDHQERVINT